MTIHELRVNSNKFIENLENHIAEVVNDNPYLTELNRKQLKQSKLSTGATIKPKYSRSYSHYKGFQYPDLRDTGDFYAAMYTKYQNNEYIIDSEDWKTEKLVNKYSPLIFGISKENQPFAQKVTTSMLAVIYKQEVFGK